MVYSSSVATTNKIEGDVPVYPDRIVFAEDLVNYIINDLHDVDFPLNGSERLREITYNALSESIKRGVSYIAFTEDLPCNTHELNAWDKGAYFSITTKMEEMFFKKDLASLEFLCFCVHVALLAREFLRNGLLNAASLAVIVIYGSLINYDMFVGGLDSLKLAARNILDWDEALMTPDDSSIDTSDGEWRHMMSRSPSPDISNDDAELRQIHSFCTVSSDESDDENQFHAAVSEDASIFNEDTHGENPQLANVSMDYQHIHPANDNKPLQQVCEYQRVVEVNEISTAYGAANMCETSSTAIDKNLYFEYIEFRALAILKRSSYTEDDD